MTEGEASGKGRPHARDKLLERNGVASYVHRVICFWQTVESRVDEVVGVEDFAQPKCKHVLFLRGWLEVFNVQRVLSPFP